MTETMTAPSEGAAYVARVRAALSDLPDAEREDLLAEVEAAIAEGEADPSGSLAARLGAPEDFAAELRTAAGFAPAGPSAHGAPRWPALLARAQGPGRELARELAPVWWLYRGYVLLVIVAAPFLFGLGFTTRLVGPFVPVLGVDGIALLAVFSAAALSFAAGRRQRRGPRSTLLTGVNIALAVAAVPVTAALLAGEGLLLRPAQVEPAATPVVQGLARDGVPVTNLYAFTSDGRPLRDVLIYDGDGEPVTVAADVDDPDRRLLRTRGAEPVFNSFPIRYYEPGTRIVARPNAMPEIDVPALRKPPPMHPRRR